MLKSLLVAVDGSEYSQGALECVSALAGTTKPRCTLLYIIDVVSLEGPFLADLSGSIGLTPFLDFQQKVRTAMEHKAAEVLESGCKTLMQAGMECETRTETGIVSRTICNVAMEYDAVIVGRRGEHARWKGFLLGSVVEDVVRGSAKPVIVTPRSVNSICRILAAYDGSRTANRALGVGASLAAGLGVPMAVVTVHSDSREGNGLLDEAESFLEPHGITPDKILESGPVVDGILSAADRSACDLVVMGAFGHSRVRELILGSTTDGVLRRADVPVLLYR
jgi:nucleotide-binding universal stress UspA family protein